MLTKITRHLSAVLLVAIGLSSCTYKICNFSALSTKDIAITYSKKNTYQTSSYYPYGYLRLTYFFQPKMHKAFNRAKLYMSNDYNAVTDVRFQTRGFVFFRTVDIKGTFVKDSKIRWHLTDEEYRNWKRNNQ
jgi:hypothetical protein